MVKREKIPPLLDGSRISITRIMVRMSTDMVVVRVSRRVRVSQTTGGRLTLIRAVQPMLSTTQHVPWIM